MDKSGGLKKTGIYMRLSRDDEKAGESMSIENQRSILRNYVSERGGCIVNEYADDGWSGTDFDRPAVKRLLNDAMEGIIETIVVKDLSRFGRNYIQVGQYIDYVFPAYGIRFIALSDNIDTADRNSTAMDMMPIMNVFNEWHAATTSKKIRAVLKAKQQAGKCTNWAYPYGYIAGTDKNRTAVIDEKAAEIVRRIYDMRLQGMSFCTIARALTDNGVPCPAAHYTRLDGQKTDRFGSLNWSPKTVSDILKNPIYIGTLTQHRTERISYKNHKTFNVPESEYIIKENAHEAIIDRAIWEKVQAMRGGISHGRADGKGKAHSLSGMLVCADCGKKMKGKNGIGGRPYVYCCRTYSDLGKKYCTSHAIAEKTVEGVILMDIHSMLDKMKMSEEKEREHFIRKKRTSNLQSGLSDEKTLRACRSRLADLDKLIRSVFEEKVFGVLSESIYNTLCKNYQMEREGIQRRLRGAEERIAAVEDETDIVKYMERIRRYKKCDELTREVCLHLIEFIIIGEKLADNCSRYIHIYYKCAPPL